MPTISMKKCFLITICFCILLNYVYIRHTEAIGTTYVKFNRFLNPEGDGSNGYCCDGKWGMCQQNGCDNTFTICFDFANSTDVESTEKCGIAKYNTQHIKNKNSNTFRNYIRDVRNPLHFTMEKILSSFRIKVNIEDYDMSSNNEDIDFLTRIIDFDEIEIDSPNRKQNVGINGRTKLEMQVWYECAAQWYGKYCNIFCKPPINNEHYTCNTLTGQKVCDSGWIGTSCSIRNPCINFECHNGGECLIRDSQPKCACPTNYDGSQCELHKCEEYCLPGRCHSFPNLEQFTCICPNPTGEGEIIPDKADDGTPAKCPDIEQIIASNFTSQKFTSPKVTFSKVTTTQKITTVFENEEFTTEGNYHIFPTPGTKRHNMDCDALVQNPSYRNMNGIYEINPLGDTSIAVYCEMSTIGWTVIQRRVDDDQNFNQDWQTYKNGFGQPDPDHSFWIGLEHLHLLTNQRWYELSIELQVPDRTFRFAHYRYFYIENEENGYRLHVNGYSGTAGDGLNEDSYYKNELHNKMKFSTFDRDHDDAPYQNCAKLLKSGWWFNNCFKVNLNGVYKKYTNGKKPKCGPLGRCIVWKTIRGFREYSLMSVIMKIKPTDSPSDDILQELISITNDN